MDMKVENMLCKVFGKRYEKQLNKLFITLGSHNKLFNLTEQELVNYGCSEVLAEKIVNFCEVHQYISKLHSISRYKVSSPKTVANIMMQELRYLDKEKFVVLFLNTKLEIIGQKTISLGIADRTLVDKRIIYLDALKNNAQNIIICHNHPSGNPDPSPDDCDLTKEIIGAGKLIGIECLDHIIIGDGDYVSMKEKGLAFY